VKLLLFKTTSPLFLSSLLLFSIHHTLWYYTAGRPDNQTMAAALDIDEVRRSFPALAAGNVYFDNAGGSQTLGTVAER
jgi:hypothetical protein